jgi:galactonate dehydratase
MKITDVQTILLTGPCTYDRYLAEARQVRSAAFIRISTDCELEGIGETYAGYFLPEAVPEIVEFFKPILQGNGVEHVPTLWDRMYHCANFWCRVGLGAAVLCGIEAALWDLKGKQERMPAWRLLRDRWRDKFGGTAAAPELPCYATGGPSNFPLERLAEKVDCYRSLGFQGVKIGAGAYTRDRGFDIPNEPAKAADLESRKISYLRQQFGADLRLMLDAHMGNSATGAWGLETASAVAKALEPYGLFFLEEPLHYTRPDLYRELCASTATPIAGGECLTAYCEWQTFVDRDCFDIGQPDASFTAGMDQFMRVALALHQRGRSVAPHAWGAGASQMQNIHCGFACPNTTILEIAPAYGPLHSELIGESLQIENGFVLPPEEPGLGIQLSQATIDRYPFIRGSGEFNSVPGKVLSR